MRVVQTRNKGLVFGILFSALVVGIMMTIGQVPLAVSQPVTIPAKAIKGPIPITPHHRPVRSFGRRSVGPAGVRVTSPQM